MTAPTPDQLRNLADQAHGYRTSVDTITAMQDNLRLAADALAAVTAERDVVMLLAHRYANQATNAETERDQARQMLADAPHAESCVANVWTDDEQPFDARPCDCWKAGL